MFFCKNCGAKIENDNAKFCPKCGQKFEPKQESPKPQTINPSPLKNANASPSQPFQVQTNEKNTNINKNDAITGSKSESSIKSVTPNIPKISRQNGGKKGKGLLILLIILAVLLIGTAGTLFYLFKTGKLKTIEKKIEKVLHIKKNSSKSNNKHKHNHKVKSSSKNKKKKNTKNKSNSSNANTSNTSQASSPATSAVTAPAYVYTNNNSNRYSKVSGFSAFKTYLSSASANITNVAPLGSSAEDAPAVIISNVMSQNINASPGDTINIPSKFYAATPSNPSSQSVKLTYEVYGNGLTAYNTSYVNIDKPGIYSVNLAVKIPSNFPTGTYTYTITVTSPATIEESPAAYIKVK
ncbi:MAG: zinc-ribbon domain-containing protein [Candidatus Acidulodesulfobacterium sp.]